MDKWCNGKPENGRETWEEYFEHSLLGDDLPENDGKCVPDFCMSEFQQEAVA